MFDMTTNSYCPKCRDVTNDIIQYADGNGKIPDNMIFRMKYCCICDTYKCQDVIKKDMIKEE